MKKEDVGNSSGAIRAAIRLGYDASELERRVLGVYNGLLHLAHKEQMAHGRDIENSALRDATEGASRAWKYFNDCLYGKKTMTRRALNKIEKKWWQWNEALELATKVANLESENSSLRQMFDGRTRSTEHSATAANLAS